VRWFISILAVLGIVFASLALREHYRKEASPCAINATWDCGAVNKSEFAVFHGVPVAVIGIAGYLLLAILAFARAWKFLLPAALVAHEFSMYLTFREAFTLEQWCIYCVFSLTIITVIMLLSLFTVLVSGKQGSAKAVA
jgi:vitamin-K-epoxide reductase (warfarin-sensitive)